MSTLFQETTERVTRASDEGNLPFPQVVRQIADAGVERYYVDLVTGNRTYYGLEGDSACHNSYQSPPSVQQFSAQGVEAAVRKIQAGKLGYRQFCDEIAAAGCVAYLVSLPGRRAVYYGRTGEAYTEMFPDNLLDLSANLVSDRLPR